MIILELKTKKLKSIIELESKLFDMLLFSNGNIDINSYREKELQCNVEIEKIKEKRDWFFN